MSLTTVLQDIGATDQHLSMSDLKGLSGLDRKDRQVFWDAWSTITPERRFEVAHAMVELAEDEIEVDFGEAWYWMLDDQDAGVRAAAIEGLWEDTTPRVLRQLLHLLRHDPSADVRSAAAIGLSRFAYLAALDELDDYAEPLEQALLSAIRDPNETADVQRRALESAGYFAESNAAQTEVARAYESGDQLLCESALVAMGRSVLPRWLPLIGRSLESQSPALRYEAARAAGEMADVARPLLPKVMPLVNDQDTEVSLAAIWALGQIGGESARNALQRLRKSQDMARSQAASEALNELSLEDGIL